MPSDPNRIGKYEILKPLAVGGMAEILLARSTGVESFEKYVVIKRILPQFASDESFISMFLDEARIAAQLHHQNIAQVFDIGVSDGDFFFTMEHLHGEDARSLLQATAGEQKRIPLPHALTIVAGVAAGLHYAHERVGPDGLALNIVHRDVSPSNIFITYDGAVKLVDFGVARAAQRSTKTRSGTTKGKAGYMSPEACRSHEIDRRSDVFSLGVVLYELTTSSRLFERNAGDSDYEVMHRIVTSDFVPPSAHLPGYPKNLEAIVLKMLASDPKDRYATAQILLEQIEQFAAEHRIALSSSALAQYVKTVFERRQEPQRESSLVEPEAEPLPAPPEVVTAQKIPTVTVVLPAAPARTPAPEPTASPRRRLAVELGVTATIVVAFVTVALWQMGSSEPKRSEAGNPGAAVPTQLPPEKVDPELQPDPDRPPPPEPEPEPEPDVEPEPEPTTTATARKRSKPRPPRRPKPAKPKQLEAEPKPDEHDPDSLFLPSAGSKKE